MSARNSSQEDLVVQKLPKTNKNDVEKITNMANTFDVTSPSSDQDAVVTSKVSSCT